MTLDLRVLTGLLVVFLIVFIGPFRARAIEHNLEGFMFICGISAVTISGFADIPGSGTGWSLR